MKLKFRDEPTYIDLDGIRKIVSESGFFSEEEVSVAVELAQDRLNQGGMSDYEFIFVEEDGGSGEELLGYSCFGRISLTNGSYDLYWIAVSAKLRGQGIGKKILDESEKAILKSGGKRIYIETSSRKLYQPTQGFYTHCGYNEEARLKNFYDIGDSKIIYSKSL